MTILTYKNMVKFLTMVKQYMDDHLSEDMSWGIKSVSDIDITSRNLNISNSHNVIMKTCIKTNDMPIEISFQFDSSTGNFYPDETNFFLKIKQELSSAKSLNGHAQAFIDVFADENDDNPTIIEITDQINAISIGLFNTKSIRIKNIFSQNDIHPETFSDKNRAELRISKPEEEFDYALIQITNKTWTFI